MTEMFDNEENKAREVRTIVDSEAMDYCFVNINIFKEYKKFETLLTGKMTQKKISFRICQIWFTLECKFVELSLEMYELVE